MRVKRLIVGTVAAAVVAMGVSAAWATAVIPNDPLAAPELTCADTLQKRTNLYVDALQDEIRKSIRLNAGGRDSVCNGGFACAGGANNGLACTVNSDCCAVDGGNPTCNVYGIVDDLKDPSCLPNDRKGIVAAILRAKARFRIAVAGGLVPKCTTAMMPALGYPNSRCFDPTDTAANKTTPVTIDEVLDCILKGAIGDLVSGVIGDPAGEIMARAATDIVADSLIVPGNSILCPVSLGSELQIGVTDFDTPLVAQAGVAAPSRITSWIAGVCDLEGQGIVGNILSIASLPGALPLCHVTISAGVSPLFDKPSIGTIDLSGPDPGKQTFSAPAATFVLIGSECPRCTATKVCDAGPNSGSPCNNAGDVDPICVPTFVGTEPIIPNAFTLLTTETTVLSAPANGAGVVNPAGAMCGNCDAPGSGTPIGCQNDADCDTPEIGDQCTALSGCCQFNGNKGAFGDTSATKVIATGKRGPYLPLLAGAYCTGKTATGLDALIGLPGPVRFTQSQLNAFNYVP